MQANGQNIKVSGIMQRTARVGEVNTEHKLYVAPTLCKSMVLGRDLIEKNSTQLNFGNALLIISEKKIHRVRHCENN